MPDDPSPQAAPVVPGHVLEELLGRGGSGQVWRARPRGGGDPVAVKVLVRGDPARQVREAALLAELDHPHLVRLHRVVRREVRSGPAEVSLVLDLLDGGSLAALLARRGRLRPGEVVTAIAPVAAALAHAHERGIVHGDLSPGNIVFTAEGRPVLTDLGTAGLVGEAARGEVTPAYVDPVVARGGAPGPASDVFGVAAAAFHALTGIAPWNAADPGGTLGVAAGGHLPDLAMLAPDAPEELVRVVQRGLSADPHLRLSAAAFALDLRHACRPEPVRLPTPGVPDEALGETGRGPRTELTHQVAGRSGRAAHAAPVTAGRWARLRAAVARWRPEDGPWRSGLAGPVLRRWAVSVAAVLVLAGGLAGAAWAGASWGSGDAGRTAPAAGSGNVPADVDPPPPAAPGPAAPGSAPPPPAGEPVAGDLDGWASLVQQLYAQRSLAYATADSARLTGVYVPGSDLLQRDADQVDLLAEAGQSVLGFDPRVLRVTAVTGGSDRVVVHLVDEVPGHRLVVAGRPGGARAQEVAGRGPVDVRMTLQRTADGWRIAEAIRPG
jgi:hypothetical protein